MLRQLQNTTKNFDIIGFGEVMLRLSPEGKERISQGETFEKRAGGSELNVVSGISLLGLRTGILTKLPDNAIGSFVKNRIRFCGVSDDYLIFDRSPSARLGVYYYEGGAYPRKPVVTYDRQNSSVTTISLSEIDESIFQNTKLFHVSGITLALSENTRRLTIEMIKKFKKNGVVVSFDVNYRATLWSEEEAKATIEEILPFVDILFISEETSRRCFQRTGSIEDIMKGYCSDYGVSIVATTERKVISPTKHSFSSKIYSREEDKIYTEPEYSDIEIIDRIGSGDAYLSGVLFGILKYADLQKALEIGNAMSALKNTIPGDMTSCDLEEIESVINAHKKIGPQSEMNR